MLCQLCGPAYRNYRLRVVRGKLPMASFEVVELDIQDGKFTVRLFISRIL